MSDDNTDITNKIEEIEKQLRELRIELGQRRSGRRTGPFEIGEEVEILNPRGGQAKSGKLTKVNAITRFVTIDATSAPTKRKEKAVRSFSKIARKQNNEE
jgi:50S ribosomal subunit-associated GTPase HflX